MFNASRCHFFWHLVVAYGVAGGLARPERVGYLFCNPDTFKILAELTQHGWVITDRDDCNACTWQRRWYFLCPLSVCWTPSVAVIFNLAVILSGCDHRFFYDLAGWASRSDCGRV